VRNRELEARYLQGGRKEFVNAAAKSGAVVMELASRQRRPRAMLPEPLAMQCGWDHLVNHTKDGDNEVVQVHGALLRSVATGPEDIKRRGLGLLPLSQLAHRVSQMHKTMCQRGDIGQGVHHTR
jgi:hypothetical protein